MRKFLFLLLAAPLFAQPSNSPIVSVTVAPSGSCSSGLPNQQVISTGVQYSCQNGTWGAINGGSSGSGTVNSGTTGQIAYYPSSAAAVSGATLPSLGIAPGAINVLNYGATSDASTDNASAFTAAFAVSNAITSGFPTVYFPCKYGTQCQYNYSGASTSSINPTIGTTILCDTGVTLRYSGSAHMMDIGPSGRTLSNTDNTRYRITGCRLTDTGSATQDIFVNTAITNVEVDNVTFYDTPKSASSTAFAFFANGDNWDLNIHDNDCQIDNGTAINCFRSQAGASVDSQSRFFHNRVVCWPAVPVLVGCSDTGGVGIWVDGWGSVIQGNNLAFMKPDIRVGPSAPYTKITDNYFESANSSTTPAIQYGNPGDGATTYVDGLMIANNNFDTQQNASESFLGPTTANNLLTNLKLDGLHGLNVSATSVIVAQNNTAGQLGNEVQHVRTTPNTTLPATTNLLIHTLGTNIAPWKYLDQLTNSDSLSGSGALASPWVNITGTGIGASLSVGSGVASCASSACESAYAVDTSSNVKASITLSTVTTGTDQIFVMTRTNMGTAGSGLQFYECTYINGTGIQMYKLFTNSFTQLGSTYSATTPVAGDRLILESIGSTHTCYLQKSTGLFSAVGPVVDTAISVGYAGMGLSGASGRLGTFMVWGMP